jgi:chromosomal replication initiation ATPase DnaA
MYMGTAVVRRGPLYYKLLEIEKQKNLERIEKQRRDRLMEMHQKAMEEAQEKQKARQALLMDNATRTRLPEVITLNHEAIPNKVIMEATALHFNIPVSELLGESRTYNICRARQIAFYLCCKLAHRGWSEMKHYTGRDHTTVLHAYRKVSAAIQDCPKWSADVHAVSVGVMVEVNHDPHFWGS